MVYLLILLDFVCEHHVDSYFFPSNLSIFYLFFFIALAKTSKTTLNENGNSENSYLITNFKRKAFNVF